MRGVRPIRYLGAERIPRHRHEEPYAALVIEGGYIEAGDRGRLIVEAGYVVIHGPYEAHQDAFAPKGTVVLNFPIDLGSSAVARVADPDSLVRLAERDLDAACDLLAASLIATQNSAENWSDRLSRDIIEHPDLDLGEWADAYGLAPQSVSRGFRQAFGITPKRFRSEQRALRAVRLLPRWNGTGAALAADLGFADQAHMTRSVAGVTGRRPRELRLSGFNTGPGQIR